MTGPASRLLLLLVALAGAIRPASSFGADPGIDGEGATFPAPVYQAWISGYQRETGRVVRYAATGSGAGIDRLEQGLVDFGATDAPLDEVEARRFGIVQFPVLIGAVVPVFNITGIKAGDLRLSGAVLSDIYLGKIARWDDPAIVALNPDLALPSSNITVVHRADASGTTFLWTGFLSSSSSEWKERVGTAKEVRWPVGVSDTGNEGVASFVQRTRMSIGYVEYAYAYRHRLTFASLRNRDGAFVLPGRASFEATVAAASWKRPLDLDQLLVDAPGAASWPIVGSSFILVKADAGRGPGVTGTLAFFDWALKHGSRAAGELEYVAMPDSAVEMIHQKWSRQIVDARGRPLWPAGAARKPLPN